MKAGTFGLYPHHVQISDASLRDFVGLYQLYQILVAPVEPVTFNFAAGFRASYL